MTDYRSDGGVTAQSSAGMPAEACSILLLASDIRSITLTIVSNCQSRIQSLTRNDYDLSCLMMR